MLCDSSGHLLAKILNLGFPGGLAWEREGSSVFPVLVVCVRGKRAELEC